jgi:hypothetical protein
LEKKRAEQVLPRSRELGVGGGEEVAVYTHVSKCKNDKRRRKNK